MTQKVSGRRVSINIRQSRSPDSYSLASRKLYSEDDRYMIEKKRRKTSQKSAEFDVHEREEEKKCHPDVVVGKMSTWYERARQRERFAAFVCFMNDCA